MDDIFVGKVRKQLVKKLIAEYKASSLSDNATPKMQILSAPMGWGKTAVIQEFYRVLARDFQVKGKEYWPEQITSSRLTSGVVTKRKVLYPSIVDIKKSCEIKWMWLGLTCGTRSDGYPVNALNEASPQIIAHSIALESLKNKSLKDYLNDVGFGSVDEVYQSGSPVLGLIAGLSSIANPVFGAIALTPTLIDLAKRTIHHTRQIYSSRNRLDYSKGVEKLITQEKVDVQKGIESAKKIIDISNSYSPIVIAVEDIHLADTSLCSFLSCIMKSACKILIVSTAHPECFDSELTKYENFNSFLKSNNGHYKTCNLPPMDILDFKDIIINEAPNTERDVLDYYANRFYPNPLALKQSFEFLKVKRSIKNKAITLSKQDIETLDANLEAQYKARWKELPDNIKYVLTISAFLGREFLQDVSIELANLAGVHKAGDAINKVQSPLSWVFPQDESVLIFLEKEIFKTVRAELNNIFTEVELKELSKNLKAITLSEYGYMNSLNSNARLTLTKCLYEFLVNEMIDMSGEQTALIALELSQGYFLSGDYDGSIRVIDSIYDKVPTIFQPQILLSKMKTLFYLGRYEEVLIEYTKCLGIRDINKLQKIELEYIAAETEANQGDYELARLRLEEIGVFDESTGLGQKIAILNCRLDAENGQFTDARDKARLLLKRGITNISDELDLKMSLSWYLSRTGDSIEALKLAKENMEEVVYFFGCNSKHSLEATNNYLRFLDRCGEHKKAALEGRELLVKYDRVLGETHLDTLKALNNQMRYERLSGFVEQSFSFAKLMYRRWNALNDLKHPKALDGRLERLLTISKCSKKPSEEEITQLMIDFDSTLGKAHPNYVRAKKAVDSMRENYE